MISRLVDFLDMDYVYQPVLFSYITAVSYVDISSQSPTMTSSIAISEVSRGPLEASKTT